MKNYVEEIHQLVGAAMTTRTETEALKIASRLCDIVREAQADKSRATNFMIQEFLGLPKRKPRRRTKE